MGVAHIEVWLMQRLVSDLRVIRTIRSLLSSKSVQLSKASSNRDCSGGVFLPPELLVLWKGSCIYPVP